MGEPGQGGQLVTFFGTSEGRDGNPAKLSEALSSAAGEAIKAGLVGGGKTAWFDITTLEVELANQHPKTLRVGVTPKEGRG
jgi:hypothetical protein